MEETPSSVREVILEFIHRNILFAGLIIVGLVLTAIGIFQYFSSKSTSEVEFVKNDQKVEETSQKTPILDITVDIAGEVKNPGVYVLKEGSRLKDLIDAAGGFTKNSDSEYISKRLNLAQKISDGGKIYIPAVGEITTQSGTGLNPVQEVQAGFSTGGSVSEANSLININSASESQLDTLPKVGPVTAKKIIDGRPYMTIEELVSKKVMTQKTFEGLKDKIVAQ